MALEVVVAKEVEQNVVDVDPLALWRERKCAKELLEIAL